MSTLNEYLDHKRTAWHARQQQLEAGQLGAAELNAQVAVEGRSGIRRIRIRGHQILSDSLADFAGYDLGPSSPELQLGALGSCLTHIFLIHAADQRIPVDSLRVDVSGRIDPRAGRPGHESTPIWPHDIGYTVHIESPADEAAIQSLFETVERACPILNLLKQPQSIRAEIRHVRT